MKKKDKNFNSSKAIVWPSSALFGAIVGFIFGMTSDLPPYYTAMPRLVNIIIFVLTYFLAVGLHELGHAISFSKNGIKMRALFITMFLFIKEDKKWKLKIRPNKVTAIGGIAIPDIGVVKDEIEFKKLQNAYSKAILAGPISSIALFIVGILISILVISLSSNVYVISGFYSFAKYLSVISLFLLFSCIFKSEVAVGDFPAYTLAKKDSFFVAMQLYQYAIVSSDYKRVRSENKYLKEVLLNGLSEKLENKDTHIFTLNLIDTFIIEYLAGMSNELPTIVKDYIEFLLDNPEWMTNLKNYEVSNILRFHILRLIYSEDIDKATKLYEDLKKHIKQNNPVMKYYIKQTDDLFGYADNSSYLNDKNNIKISSAHGIFKNFEGYFVDEMKINEMNTTK